MKAEDFLKSKGVVIVNNMFGDWIRPNEIIGLMEQYHQHKLNEISEWVSVEDKKPKLYEGVLVYIKNQDTIANACLETNGDWVEHYNSELIEHFYEKDGVTHWQPLPQPPKDKLTKQ